MKSDIVILITYTLIYLYAYEHVTLCVHYFSDIRNLLIVWVYGILTFVGYLMPNPLLYK